MPKTCSATSVIVDSLPQCVLATPGCCEPTRRLKTIAENIMIVALYSRGKTIVDFFWNCVSLKRQQNLNERSFCDEIKTGAGPPASIVHVASSLTFLLPRKPSKSVMFWIRPRDELNSSRIRPGRIEFVPRTNSKHCDKSSLSGLQKISFEDLMRIMSLHDTLAWIFERSKPPSKPH